MQKISLLTAFIGLLFFTNYTTTLAQSETPKFELGAQFSVINLQKPGIAEKSTDVGFGGRFTYNVTPNVALEAETNFFPRNRNTPSEALTTFGRKTEGLFGTKVGVRREKVGFLVKPDPDLFTTVEFLQHLFALSKLDFRAGLDVMPITRQILRLMWAGYLNSMNRGAMSFASILEIRLFVIAFPILPVAQGSSRRVIIFSSVPGTEFAFDVYS